MNNQPDPAIEAALERAEKLLSRDPQLRRKYWIELIISLCTLALFFILIFAPDKTFENSIFDTSGLNGYLTISFYLGYGLGIYIFILLDTIKHTIKENKILKAISKYITILKFEHISKSETFTKNELKTINNITKTRIINFISSWGTVGFTGGALGLLFFLFSFLTSIWAEYSPFTGPNISCWIYVFIIGIIAGGIFYISLLAAVNSICALFKTNKHTYHEQLLMKLRKIKTEE